MIGFVLAAGPAQAADPATIRIGHFPNITHIQALIAHGMTRQGTGWFEPRLGPEVKIEWFIYNAGPSATEAIFADSIDLTYIGPSPAINAYAKAKGTEIRIISGAVNGGSALVVQPDENLRVPADFRGKRLATPQLGNTQDVAARAWLAQGGLKISLTGGDASIIPTQNADQLGLFLRRELDAVWTVEPWVSRLELEAGGEVLIDEADAVTTVVVSSVKFLDGHPDLVAKFRLAEAELTQWTLDHPAEAQEAVAAELLAETRGRIAPELIRHAWDRIHPTNAVSRDALEQFVNQGKEAGLLKAVPDLAKLVVEP